MNNIQSFKQNFFSDKIDIFDFIQNLSEAEKFYLTKDLNILRFNISNFSKISFKLYKTTFGKSRFF